MRRWLAAVVYVGAVGLLLAGCGRPAGVDGALVDDWGPLPEPTSFTPAAGVCLAGAFADTAYLSAFNPVECAVNHRTETVHVGTFTGAAGQRVAPPPATSPQRRAAFAECNRKATEYVGGEWRSARLQLGVATPSAAAWRGGARWFRCDLAEVSNLEDDGPTVTSTGSFKGVLKSRSPLRLGCYSVNLTRDGSIDTMPAIDCGRRHNSEFAGVWKAPDIPYPSKKSDWDRFYAGCRKVIAKYVGVPADGNLHARTGVVALPNGRGDWAAGNRGVRCYLWLSDGKLTKSLKGAGSAGLPIRYR